MSMLAANGVALLILKVIDLGILAAQGRQDALKEQQKISDLVTQQIATGQGLTQAYIDQQTKRIKDLETRLFEDPEGMDV